MQAAPGSPLPIPSDQSNDRSDVALGDRGLAFGHRREVQDFFLDVGGQVEHVHDLCHPGSRDVAQLGKLGLVTNGPRGQEMLKTNCQGHQPREAWQTARRRIRRFLPGRFSDGPAGIMVMDECESVFLSNARFRH